MTQFVTSPVAAAGVLRSGAVAPLHQLRCTDCRLQPQPPGGRDRRREPEQQPGHAEPALDGTRAAAGRGPCHHGLGECPHQNRAGTGEGGSAAGGAWKVSASLAPPILLCALCALRTSTPLAWSCTRSSPGGCPGRTARPGRCAARQLTQVMLWGNQHNGKPPASGPGVLKVLRLAFGLDSSLPSGAADA